MFERAFSSVCKAPRSKPSTETLPVGADSQLHAGFRAHRRITDPAELPADDFANYIAEAQRRSDRANQVGPERAAPGQSALTPEERRLVGRQRKIWWGIIISTQLLYVSTIISLVLFIVKFKTVGHPWYLIWFLLSFGFMFATTVALWVLWDRRRVRRQVERDWMELETRRWRHTARERERQAERAGTVPERLGPVEPAGPSIPPRDRDAQREILHEQPMVQNEIIRPIIHPRLPELPQHSMQTQTGGFPAAPDNGPLGHFPNTAQGATWERPVLVDKVGLFAHKNPTSPISPSVYTDRFSGAYQHTKAPASRVGSPSDHIVSPYGHRVSALSRGDEHRGKETVLSSMTYMQNRESRAANQPRLTSSKDDSFTVKPTDTIPQPRANEYNSTPRASVVVQDIFRALHGTSFNNQFPSSDRKGHARSITELTSRSLPAIPPPPAELPAEQGQHRASSTAPANRSSASTGRESVSDGHPKRLSSLRNYVDSVPVLEPELRKHLDARLSSSQEVFSASPPISSEPAPRPTTAYAEDGWGAFASFNLPPYPDAKPRVPQQRGGSQAPTHDSSTDGAGRSLGIEDDLGGLRPPGRTNSGKSATPSSSLLPLDPPYSIPKQSVKMTQAEHKLADQFNEGSDRAIARDYDEKEPAGPAQSSGQKQYGINGWLSTMDVEPATRMPATRKNGEVDRGRQLRRGGSTQRVVGVRSTIRDQEGSDGSKEPNWLD